MTDSTRDAIRCSYTAPRIDLTTAVPEPIHLDASYAWQPRFHATRAQESILLSRGEWLYSVRFNGPVLTPRGRDHATNRASTGVESVEECPEAVRPLLRGPDALLAELAAALPLPASTS